MLLIYNQPTSCFRSSFWNYPFMTVFDTSCSLFFCTSCLKWDGFVDLIRHFECLWNFRLSILFTIFPACSARSGKISHLKGIRLLPCCSVHCPCFCTDEGTWHNLTSNNPRIYVQPYVFWNIGRICREEAKNRVICDNCYKKKSIVTFKILEIIWKTGFWETCLCAAIKSICIVYNFFRKNELG